MPKSEYSFISWLYLSKILIKYFWFQKVSQKWSHLKLKNWNKVTIIPLHKELAYWTFKSVLTLWWVSEYEFNKVTK